MQILAFSYPNKEYVYFKLIVGLIKGKFSLFQTIPKHVFSSLYSKELLMKLDESIFSPESVNNI